MTKDELLEKLQFLFLPENEIGLVMYMILQTNNGFDKKKADITDEVRNELKAQFINYINQKFITNADLHFTGVTNADNRKNTAFYYDLEEKPVDLEVMTQLVENENMPLYDFNIDNYDNIVGFVFLLGNETIKIAIYKKQYPISLMKRDSVLMLIKADTRLKKVQDDILKVNESFEFMQIDCELIVISLKTLEKYFGFENVIRNQAKNNLETISKANLLEDIEPLKEMADKLKFARKLIKLKSDSVVLQLPFEKVRTFIQNHPKLRKRMRFNSTNSRIALDTNVSKELFLKLLDDDFLKSDLTELLYESDVKDQITNEETIDA